MSFDPTTAVPVEEATEFDPTTASPVEESRLLGQFDPSTASVMSREDEIAMVNKYLSPDYVAQSKEEFAQLRKLETDLKSEGAIPGDFENAAKAVGGMFVSLADAAGSLVTSPLESWRRSPATLQTGVGMAALSAMELGGFVKQGVMGRPLYKTADTGDYVYKPLGGLAPEISAGDERKDNLVPMSEDDLLQYDFERYLAQKGIDAENKALETKTAPTEFVQSLFVGSRQETPNLAQAQAVSIAADPTNLIPLGAGAKSIGLARETKLVSSKAARALEKSAIATADGIDNVSQRVVNKIQDITGLTEESQKTAATVVAGGVGLAGGGAMLMSNADPTTKTALTTGAAVLPMVFRYGAATLRKVGGGAGQAKVILREAADATNGLDQAARAAVIANPGVPQAYKDILENPTRFRPIESTPARLAADPRLSKQTRAVMDKLSNPLIVQGVRNTSAVAGGALKGTLANAPFAAAAYAAGEDQDAATMLLGGAAFGSIGAAGERIGGVRQRRAEAQASDIGRMLIDVELNAGDVGKLVQTYSPQQLGDLAAMQGLFRDKVEFVPLNKTDFDLNTQANGGAGAAGLFVQAPPGEKARVFINLDAKREGIAPHEFGHALLKSGALGGAQAEAIRAHTTRRYTQAGVEARAREYARSMIENQNAAAFPGQNLPISNDAINAKMDELGQSGLLRGDIDPLDWARDELFAEDFRQASANLDFASIRRGLPADGSWLGTMEGILGGTARALSISGVRIDPATGAPIDTPATLFRDNPILATDKVLLKNLDTYIKNYRQWVTHPDQTKARGVKVAPAARPQDLANNPQVTFHDYGGGARGNEFAVLDPATGQPMLRNQADINAETAKRQQQMLSLISSKATATEPTLGHKKTADGRVTVRGRVLPQQFDFLNGFAQHMRGFARDFEKNAANGESMMVRYHAIGSGDTGSFRVKNLGNLEAITREVIPWGWELTSKGNLLASMLDLTQFRNRAVRAINEGNPTMQNLFGNDMAQVEATLKQWMDNHRQDLPGSNKIGEQKRDAINAIVGINTNMNKGANPFNGKIAGPGSAIKQFRLDRVDTAAPTGRQGFHFDYDKANGNQLPEVPTPLPDLSRDLPGQAMPDLKPVEKMTPRQLSNFLRKHGRPMRNSHDVMAHWSNGDKMWGMHEMGEDLSLVRITNMVDLLDFTPDQLMSLPREIEKDLYFPHGQAMPDVAPDTAGQQAAPKPAFEVPQLYKSILHTTGKYRVIGPDGKKVIDYPTQGKAEAKALLENNKAASIDDLKKNFPKADRDAINAAQKRIRDVAKENPEAIRLEIQRDEQGLPKIDFLEDAEGNPVLDDNGNQVRGVIFKKADYQLRNAPGLSKDDATAVRQGSDLLEKSVLQSLGIPSIAAGKGWYGRMRDFLQRSFGASIEVFGQLLGATSARTPVDTNFKQGLEALRLFSTGKYDDLLNRFDAHVMAVKAKAESGQLKSEWLAQNPSKKESQFVMRDEYRKAINTFKEVPLREKGAKYNANSQKVLHALYGIWVNQTKGPKTPNFAGNLTGRTLRATIDVWAARNLRRILYQKAGIKKWRLLPEQEQGVKFTLDNDGNYGGDFEFGQRIYDEVSRRLNMNPDDLQAIMWFAEKDVWEKNGWTNTVGAEKSSFDKEAGKLNLDRFQIGLTTFTTADQFNPKIQESERINFRDQVRKIPNLAVARVSESSGLYGGVLEPTFDVELSVQRTADLENKNYMAPTIQAALDIADRRGQIDVLTSLVVDINHPNARPMVEIGFKSPASKADIDSVVEAFQAVGIDGFTIAKNERGDILGLRSQYVPEISARYDTLDHLNPVQFAQNSLDWGTKAQTALAQIQSINNVSYRKEGYVSSAIYGKEEYRTVSPVDLRRSDAATELGRRRSILNPGL